MGDLRAIGSGNIGATNVLRTGNKGAALATLLLDAAKGGIAVLIARCAVGEDAAQLAGLAAFLGHLFPVWLGFKGGKGVATFLGTLLALAWPVGLAACATWAVAAAIWRISSLAALVAAALSGFWLFVFDQGHMLVLVFDPDRAGLRPALAEFAAAEGGDRAEDRREEVIRRSPFACGLARDLAEQGRLRG